MTETLAPIDSLLFGRKYQERSGDARHEPCAICGRDLRPGIRRYFVRTAYGSEIVDPTATLPAGADSGWFPLGSECAKHVPGPYRRSIAG